MTVRYVEIIIPIFAAHKFTIMLRLALVIKVSGAIINAQREHFEFLIYGDCRKERASCNLCQRHFCSPMSF